jgi:hypothetical protein
VIVVVFFQVYYDIFVKVILCYFSITAILASCFPENSGCRGVFMEVEVVAMS